MMPPTLPLTIHTKYTNDCLLLAELPHKLHVKRSEVGWWLDVMLVNIGNVLRQAEAHSTRLFVFTIMILSDVTRKAGKN